MSGRKSAQNAQDGLKTRATQIQLALKYHFLFARFVANGLLVIHREFFQLARKRVAAPAE